MRIRRSRHNNLDLFCLRAASAGVKGLFAEAFFILLINVLPSVDYNIFLYNDK